LVVAGRIDTSGRWRVGDSPRDLAAMALAARLHAAAPDQAFELAARAALARWLDGRCARESSGGIAPASHARRAVLARIDAALRAAGAHSRAALASRITAVRALIDHAVSAGAERALSELAHTAAAGLGDLLTRCEARLSNGATQRAPAPRELPDIAALLLLCGPA
jgi:hypothetical protein